MHQAEDGGIGADAEGQREGCDRGGAGISAEDPGGDREVLEQAHNGGRASRAPGVGAVDAGLGGQIKALVCSFGEWVVRKWDKAAAGRWRLS